MVVVKTYHLPPTPLMPNSPLPLLHYPGLLLLPSSSNNPQEPGSEEEDQTRPDRIHSLFRRNGWETQWIFRYGATQSSHYHSQTHECMAVLSGTATIRFGVADTTTDMDANTHGPAREQGGIELHAKKGDVFILPAGVAHKTFDAEEKKEFKLLTPGGGHLLQTGEGESGEEVLRGIELDGFTMIGAYPVGGKWDFAVGGESEGVYETVWAVPKPGRDPVLGDSREGLCGLW